MSPTWTTSRRLMSNTPRNPPASSGPPMTSTTMTSPSARPSPTSVEDEPITLKKKVCRPVCRRQAVMIERRDPLFPPHLTHKFRVSKKLRDTALKVNRLGLSWSNKESRFSLTVKQRFENTNSRPITTKEVSKSWMKFSSLNEEKCIVLIKETNDFDKIINFFMNRYWSKLGIFVKLMRKASVKCKNWCDFKAQHIRHNCDEKISGRSKYYPWTHWQEFRNYRMKSIACTIRWIFKMLNQYVVVIPTLSVNLCLSLLIQFLGEC